MASIDGWQLTRPLLLKKLLLVHHGFGDLLLPELLLVQLGDQCFGPAQRCRRLIESREMATVTLCASQVRLSLQKLISAWTKFFADSNLELLRNKEGRSKAWIGIHTTHFLVQKTT